MEDEKEEDVSNDDPDVQSDLELDGNAYKNDKEDKYMETISLLQFIIV